MNHYRRGLIELLDMLEFRSSNAAHRPMLTFRGSSANYPPRLDARVDLDEVRALAMWMMWKCASRRMSYLSEASKALLYLNSGL